MCESFVIIILFNKSNICHNFNWRKPIVAWKPITHICRNTSNVRSVTKFDNKSKDIPKTKSQLSLSEIELKAWTVKPNGNSLTRSPFNLIHRIPCCVGIRTVRFEPAGALLTFAVEENPATAKPFRSAAGISDVKQYLNLPFLPRIDARFCSQSRIITSVFGRTATLHVGLRRRRTRRDNLLLCS